MVGQLVLAAGLLVLGAVDETFAVHPRDVVVGGQPAELGEFPFYVSLRNYTAHFCGGCLIGNQYVLTAAHCIVGVVEPPFIGITAVTGTISSSEGGEHHIIKKVVVHPNYVNDIRKSYKNDIAIITLEAPVTINLFQSPIPLALFHTVADAPVMEIGVGFLSAHGIPVPTLHMLSGNVLSNKRCQSYLGKEQPIFDTNLCTRLGGRIRACSGSSDGLLIGYGYLIGIASFSHLCAEGKPNVYTRVLHYWDFINSAIKA